MFSNLSAPIWSSIHSSLPSALKRALFLESRMEKHCVHKPGPHRLGWDPFEKCSRDSNCIWITLTRTNRSLSPSSFCPGSQTKLSSSFPLMLPTPSRTQAPRYLVFRSLGSRVQLRGTTNYKQPVST